MAGEGRSLYAGLRVTMMRVPESDTALVTVTAKRVRGGWDEWSALAPMRRIDAGSVASTRDALLALSDHLQWQAENLGY